MIRYLLQEFSNADNLLAFQGFKVILIQTIETDNIKKCIIIIVINVIIFQN